MPPCAVTAASQRSNDGQVFKLDQGDLAIAALFGVMITGQAQRPFQPRRRHGAERPSVSGSQAYPLDTADLREDVQQFREIPHAS